MSGLNRPSAQDLGGVSKAGKAGDEVG
jgi:hypothetical protein